MMVRLMRGIDEIECVRRNALRQKRPGYVLRHGEIGTILETFEDGRAYLVEFGHLAPDACDWLGVLYPTEVEVLPAAAAAA